MLITVNGEVIDYSLENEHTLGDVVQALSSWLNNSNFLLETLKIDNSFVALTDTSWGKKTIDSTAKLEITTVNLRDNPLDQLSFLQDYLILLKDSTSKEIADTYKDIVNGYTAFRYLLEVLTNLNSKVSMPALEDALSAMSKGCTPENIEQLGNELTILDELLENVSRELLQPWQHALKYAAALTELTENFEFAAVALQTGKDRVAMETIINLSELLQSFIRCISWSSEAFDIKVLHGLLEELEEALKTEDSVLIGDLLEYEIKPILLNLPQALKSVKKG